MAISRIYTTEGMLRLYPYMASRSQLNCIEGAKTIKRGNELAHIAYGGMRVDYLGEGQYSVTYDCPLQFRDRVKKPSVTSAENLKTSWIKKQNNALASLLTKYVKITCN